MCWFKVKRKGNAHETYKPEIKQRRIKHIKWKEEK